MQILDNRETAADALDRLPSTICLTFDMDWAPDWCVEECVALCRKANVKATFFVTHVSPILESLREDPRFELGIHPNFLPNSSHGDHPGEIMASVLAMVPEARSMRTHALVQSWGLFGLIADFFPRIETDVSLLLPMHPGLQPTDLFAGKSGRRITRLPYFWEDDTFAGFPSWQWQLPPPAAGLRIFDFHPVYLSLNMARMDGYREIKRRLGRRPLYEATRDDFAPFLNADAGCRDVLTALLRTTPADAFQTVSEVTDEYRRRVSWM